MNTEVLINNIRKHSRNLVRELGFLNKTLAGTDLTPSQVHALVEINKAGSLLAKELSEILLLEKSTISRLVKNLVKRGEIKETPSSTDIRKKNIQLTKKGKKTVSQITRYAKKQVKDAVYKLDTESQMQIELGLTKYSKALEHSRLGLDITKANENTITPAISVGYAPGLIGRIIQMHAVFYSRFAGFDVVFENTVAKGISDFVPRLDKTHNSLWYASMNEKIIGSIAIDGEDLGKNIAHLRWFIVENKGRHQGVGRKLLKKALKHCEDKGFQEVHLWTFRGLDAARKLYEENGFILEREYEGNQWGKKVMEQKFIKVIQFDTRQTNHKGQEI